LLGRVAIAEGDAFVLERLAVDGDAERRAGLVLAAIATADRSLVVVIDVEAVLEFSIKPLGDIGHAVLLHEGKDGRLDGCDARVQLETDALGRLGANAIPV